MMNIHIDPESSSVFFRLKVENVERDIVHKVYIDIDSDYDEAWAKIGAIAEEYENTHDGDLVREIKYIGYIDKVKR